MTGKNRTDGAKPTEFDGVLYRSRMEARWAVFFDRLGVKYAYEPVEFTLSDGRKYTPDFYVEDFDTYIEMKPDDEEIILEEAGKALILSRNRPDLRVWLAMGPPNTDQSTILDFSLRDKFYETLKDGATLQQFIENIDLRSHILEDRRDEFLYWLSGCRDWSFGYLIGGPGTETDHTREPILHWNAEAAYKKAAAAFRNDRPEEPWGDNPF